jgi:MFS transporter, DHA2 family, multidrug resistance protein
MAEITPLHGFRLGLLTVAVSFGILMNVLDISIANVAIPTIAGNLAISPDNGTWVITSFAVSQAVMLPITGWLAKQFGEVKLFVYSTILFTIASVLCGLATDFPMLVFFRILQGAVSGPMIPLSQSLLLATYPEEKKSFAIGLWGMTAIVGPIAGPILGGWITDNYSWPWIFYINVPIGIFAATFTAITLRGCETEIKKLPIDYIGLILLIIGVGCLQVFLDKGNDLDWFNSNIILTLAIVSFISLCYFVVWELGSPNPIVDLTLLARRNFLIGSIALTLGYLLYFANVVIFPLWLQTQMGYTPTWAGLAAAPVGVLPFLLLPIVGRYMMNFDLRIIISIGFIIFAWTSFWQSNFYTEVGYAQLAYPRLVQGLGVTFFFTPLITLILSGLPSWRTASASGLSNFFRILGGSFGTSISVTLWSRREAFHHSRLVEHVNPFNSFSSQILEQLQHAGFSRLQSFGMLDNIISNQAYMLATNDFFWITGVTFIILIFIVWWAKPPFKQVVGVASE